MSNKSDVARLLEQVGNEYTSAQQALYGLSEGSARHQFISARYDRIGELQGDLGKLVGHDDAARLIVEQLDKSGGQT